MSSSNDDNHHDGPRLRIRIRMEKSYDTDSTDTAPTSKPEPRRKKVLLPPKSSKVSTMTTYSSNKTIKEVMPSSEIPMSGILHPHKNDVLMGRGGKNNQHSGNEKLREIARERCDEYQAARKKIKSDISRELVQIVRQMSPPGRFLRKDSKTSFWEDVGDDVAREKASQVLRDAVMHQMFNSSPKSKREKSDDDSHLSEEQQETVSVTEELDQSTTTIITTENMKGSTPGKEQSPSPESKNHYDYECYFSPTMQVASMHPPTQYPQQEARSVESSSLIMRDLGICTPSSAFFPHSPSELSSITQANLFPPSTTPRKRRLNYQHSPLMSPVICSSFGITRSNGFSSPWQSYQPMTEETENTPPPISTGNPAPAVTDKSLRVQPIHAKNKSPALYDSRVYSDSPSGILHPVLSPSRGSRPPAIGRASKIGLDYIGSPTEPWGHGHSVVPPKKKNRLCPLGTGHAKKSMN